MENTSLRTLEINEMERIEGGFSWACAGAIALGVVAVAAGPATGVFGVVGAIVACSN